MAWWNANKAVPRCMLITGIRERRDVVYKQEVFRFSQDPYTFRYSDPTVTITGIACVPLRSDIQSPEVDIIEGGINFSYVTIRLTPVQKGRWACVITIYAKPSAAKPDVKTGRADACDSERSSRTILQCRRLVEGTPEERDALQDMTFARRSREPYDYEYSKPGYTFTGISCLPVSAEIPSPEAEVISGGINCSSVTIRLTPVEEGEWACRVLICGRLCTTRPSAGVSEQTGRADSSAPASSAPPAGTGYVVQLH